MGEKAMVLFSGGIDSTENGRKGNGFIQRRH